MLATVCLHSNQRSGASLTFPQGKDKYGCPGAPRKERPHRSIGVEDEYDCPGAPRKEHPHRSIGVENLGVPRRLFSSSVTEQRQHQLNSVPDDLKVLHHINMHI